MSDAESAPPRVRGRRLLSNSLTSLETALRQRGTDVAAQGGAHAVLSVGQLRAQGVSLVRLQALLGVDKW